MSITRIPSELLDGEELLPFAATTITALPAVSNLALLRITVDCDTEFAGQRPEYFKFGAPNLIMWLIKIALTLRLWLSLLDLLPPQRRLNVSGNRGGSDRRQTTNVGT